MTDTNRASYEHHPIIQEFHQWVKENQIEGVQGTVKDKQIEGIQGSVETSSCFFLPISTLKKRFTPRYLAQLKSVLPRNEGSDFNSKDILDHDYCKAFCILLMIGKGEYIEYFLRHSSLCDQKLPFEPESRPPKFPHDPNDPGLFKKFCEKQWLLCAPEFKKKSKSSYRKEEILPIVEHKYRSQGGSARIFEIKLHQCYDKFDEPKDPEVNANPFLLTELLRALAKLEQAQRSQHPKTYILKQYHTEAAERDYNAEVKACRLLSRAQNVIKFYMGYEQGNTYNVILEYADKGDLEDFFKNTPPPSTGIDICHFFEGMFGLAEAVKEIHEPLPGDDGQERQQGWHQDIHPRNILVQSNGDSRESPFEYNFKLGDFGISHFKSRGASWRQATDIDTSGTLTYGAPETYRPNRSFDKTRLRVPPAVDIWSLCTVWSEACIWVAYGMEGLNKYRQIRGAATKAIPKFRAGNCFHDGHNVLDVVGKIHNIAQHDLRRSDFLTHEVWLQLIEPNLISSSDRRSDATAIWKLSARILANAKSMLHDDSTLFHEEFLQPPQNGVGTFTRKRASSFGKTVQFDDGRNNDLPSKDIRSLFNPVMQLDGGAQPDPLATRSSTGYETDNENTLDQGFQEQVNVQHSHHVNSLQCADPKKLFISKQPKQTHDYTEPASPGTSVIGSRGSSYSQSAHAAASYRPTPHHRNSSSFEYLWLADEAIRWMKTKPNHKREFFEREKELKKFHPQLNGRDHVFLIDDSTSMFPYWPDVVDLLRVTLEIVNRDDCQKIKLYFTTTDGPSPQRKTESLVNEVGRKMPEGYSDMKQRLGQILDDYRTSDVSRKKSFWLTKPSRPFTLYIFTNGMWKDNIDVHKPIENIVKHLEEQKKSHRTVGIQFIRFGDDPEGSKRLDNLDNLKKRLNLSMDIVDTESSRGNVWKMLLGSFDKHFDND